jgi:hypothetical protein
MNWVDFCLDLGLVKGRSAENIDSQKKQRRDDSMDGLRNEIMHCECAINQGYSAAFGSQRQEKWMA